MTLDSFSPKQAQNKDKGGVEKDEAGIGFEKNK